MIRFLLGAALVVGAQLALAQQAAQQKGDADAAHRNKIAMCIGIVVGTPSTWNSPSARTIRRRAASRSSPQDTTLANIES